MVHRAYDEVVLVLGLQGIYEGQGFGADVVYFKADEECDLMFVFLSEVQGGVIKVVE